MIYFDLLVLLTFVWFSRKIFAFLKFPPLFGEVFAGVLAGPLILGIVQDSEPLHVLAELGIFFLMFHSGLEAHPNDLFRTSKKALIVALGGMILPFALGYFVATAFGYDVMSALFVGLVLSATAVAISARLFKDAKISGSQVAHVVMTASIITEVLVLVMLSVLLEVSRSGVVDIPQIVFLVFKFFLYFAAVFFVGQKLFPFLYRVLYKGNKGFTFSLILALSFGVIAESIGLHMIIGAFLAGLFLKKEVIDSDVFYKIEDRVFGLSYSFLGPIFFATLAFYLTPEALTGQPLFVVVLFTVAVVGKVLGSGLPALWSGMSYQKSLAIGLAMNSRGAVDLIIISLGFSQGIIGQQLFSDLVIVAFATTLLSVIAIKPLVPSIRGEKVVHFWEKIRKS